jgi:hypothetical protein
VKFFVAVSLYIAVIGLTAWSADRNGAPTAISDNISDNTRIPFINLTAATDNGQ